MHDGKDDSAALERLEAFGDNGDLVGANGKELFVIRAVPLGRGDTDEVGVSLGHRDLRVGHNGAAGICDGSRETSSTELRLRTDRRKNGNQQSEQRPAFELCTFHKAALLDFLGCSTLSFRVT